MLKLWYHVLDLSIYLSIKMWGVCVRKYSGLWVYVALLGVGICGSMYLPDQK